MRFRDVVTDSCTVVGASVGVGLLSGKEVQLFVGSYANTAVFAVIFFAGIVILRNFCRQNECRNVTRFSRACFGKASAVFLVVFCVCNFVCAVTSLAGLQSCLEELTGEKQMIFPVYAFSAAVATAFTLKAGMKLFKILNVVSVVAALAYLCCSAIFCEATPMQAKADSSVATYSMFSVLVSLSVVAPLSCEKGKQNLIATAIATLLMVVLLSFVVYVADFSLETPIFGKTKSLPMKIFGGFAISVATIASAVGNTLPVVQNVNAVVGDSGLAICLTLCLAVALSMFGFDFAMRYGYVVVAFVGFCAVAACPTKMLRQYIRRKKGRNQVDSLRARL